MPVMCILIAVGVKKIEDRLGVRQVFGCFANSLLGILGVLDVSFFRQPLRQLLRDRASGLHRFLAAHYLLRHEVAEKFTVSHGGVFRPECVAISTARLRDLGGLTVVAGSVVFQVGLVKPNDALVFREGLSANPALLVGQEFLEHLRDGFCGLGRVYDRPSDCVLR